MRLTCPMTPVWFEEPTRRALFAPIQPCLCPGEETPNVIQPVTVSFLGADPRARLRLFYGDVTSVELVQLAVESGSGDHTLFQSPHVLPEGTRCTIRTWDDVVGEIITGGLMNRVSGTVWQSGRINSTPADGENYVDVYDRLVKIEIHSIDRFPPFATATAKRCKTNQTIRLELELEKDESPYFTYYKLLGRLAEQPAQGEQIEWWLRDAQGQVKLHRHFTVY